MFGCLSLANVNAKKLASISQHSSISQADDVSSPYARVRSPSHAYDKVRPTEHPYAQVTTAGTSTGTQVVQQLSEETLSGDQPPSSRRGSHESLLANADTSQVNTKTKKKKRFSPKALECLMIELILAGNSSRFGDCRSDIGQPRASVYDTADSTTADTTFQRWFPGFVE